MDYNSHFLGGYYLSTPILKVTNLIQFSMFESTINMFQDHIGHIRDDICNSYKKIQPGTNLTSKCFTFGG